MPGCAPESGDSSEDFLAAGARRRASCPRTCRSASCAAPGSRPRRSGGRPARRARRRRGCRRISGARRARRRRARSFKSLSAPGDQLGARASARRAGRLRMNSSIDDQVAAHAAAAGAGSAAAPGGAAAAGVAAAPRPPLRRARRGFGSISARHRLRVEARRERLVGHDGACRATACRRSSQHHGCSLKNRAPLQRHVRAARAAGRSSARGTNSVPGCTRPGPRPPPGRLLGERPGLVRVDVLVGAIGERHDLADRAGGVPRLVGGGNGRRRGGERPIQHLGSGSAAAEACRRRSR